MNPQVLSVLYVLCSLLVAVVGRHRKWGFWGYFWASLLMSPVMGVLFVLAGDPQPRRRSGSVAAPAPAAQLAATLAKPPSAAP